MKKSNSPYLIDLSGERTDWYQRGQDEFFLLLYRGKAAKAEKSIPVPTGLNEKHRLQFVCGWVSAHQGFISSLADLPGPEDLGKVSSTLGTELEDFDD